MAQSVARRWVVEGKWVKDSQHFPAELRDFQVAVAPSSHQFAHSVASLRRPWPRRRPGPADTAASAQSPPGTHRRAGVLTYRPRRGESGGLCASRRRETCVRDWFGLAARPAGSALFGFPNRGSS